MLNCSPLTFRYKKFISVYLVQLCLLLYLILVLRKKQVKFVEGDLTNLNAFIP